MLNENEEFEIESTELEEIKLDFSPIPPLQPSSSSILPAQLPVHLNIPGSSHTALSASEWEIDISPAQISGDGIDTELKLVDQGLKIEFDTPGKRGKKTAKRAVIQRGIFSSIPYRDCHRWAAEIIEKGHYTMDDLDQLISFCNGNTTKKEAQRCVIRVLEISGVNCELNPSHPFGHWDNLVEENERTAQNLAELLFITLNRTPLLPGAGRFNVGKSLEEKLVNDIENLRNQIFRLICSSREVRSKILIEIHRSATEQYSDEAPDSKAYYPAIRLQNIENILSTINDLAPLSEGGRAWRSIMLKIREANPPAAFFRKAFDRLSEGAQKEDQYESRKCKTLIDELEAATNKLFTAYLPYIRRYSSRHTLHEYDAEDVFQEAFLGLVIAINSFNSGSENRFGTYCNFHLKNAVSRWESRGSRLIPVPLYHLQSTAINDENDTIDNVINDNDHANKPTKHLLFNPVYPKDENEWDEYVQCDDIPNVFEKEEFNRALLSEITALKINQKNVICMRYGLAENEALTLREISNILDISHERVRQIEKDAIRKLKHALVKRLGIKSMAELE